MMKPAGRAAVFASLILAMPGLLGACHLVDQRDFDRRAGMKPAVRSAPVKPVKGPQPLLLVRYDTPDPGYAPALRAAVQRAMAVKSDVLFTVQTLVPVAATPEAQAAAQLGAAATGREIAEAIVADGADQGQVELAVKGDPGVQTKEVRIFVH